LIGLNTDIYIFPGIDSQETFPQVLEINPHHKAIIVSGFSETNKVKEAQKLEAHTYIYKWRLKTETVSEAV
jgi:two-component system, cell cycle sensor histidine kinase and response regulator CckA